jgi:hypothetical protein
MTFSLFRFAPSFFFSLSAFFLSLHKAKRQGGALLDQFEKKKKSFFGF